MGAASPPKAIGAVLKVLLIDRFQQHRHRSLDNFVLERRFPNWAPSPHRCPPRSTCSCGGMPPGGSLRRSSGPTSSTHDRHRGRLAPQCAGVVVGRLVISRSLPSCCPAQRDARRRLPSRGSLGPLGSPPSQV